VQRLHVSVAQPVYILPLKDEIGEYGNMLVEWCNKSTCMYLSCDLKDPAKSVMMRSDASWGTRRDGRSSPMMRRRSPPELRIVSRIKAKTHFSRNSSEVSYCDMRFTTQDNFSLFGYIISLYSPKVHSAHHILYIMS
jgi:hypothetical protein